MTDDRQFDEPDFEKHVRTVLKDYKDGILDGIDEAVEAIIEHPGYRDLRDLKPIATRPIGPR